MNKNACNYRLKLTPTKARLMLKLRNSKFNCRVSLRCRKAKLESETKIIVAQIQAKASLKQTAISAGADPEAHSDPSLARIDIGDGQKGPSMEELMNTVIGELRNTLQGMQQSHQGMMQANQQLAQAIARPKQIMRDEHGNIVGVH